MGNVKYLVVNADDYGRTPGVSKGIREAHTNGIVTSTTVMMNMPGVEVELRRAQQETPKLGLGVHLVLTSGAPLLPPARVSSIVGGRNRFPTLQEFTDNLKAVDADQAIVEWDAQIQRFIKLAGRNPDHLDSHHHASYFSGALMEKMLILAEKYHCAIRVINGGPENSFETVPVEIRDSAKVYYPALFGKYKPNSPDRFIGAFYDETATTEQLLDILEKLEEGTSELMCHPGYADEILIEGSVYNRQRERELSILTSAPIRQAVERRGIQLINFGQLA
jgi:predicted glycoside hydrolase/deacetylase ChbG (UPF0249 family)